MPSEVVGHKLVLVWKNRQGFLLADSSARNGEYFLFGQWIFRAWLAFMDESQQYGNYHEIAALAALQQAMLTVFIDDHRQIPGGLSKGKQLQPIDGSCYSDH